MIYLFKIARCVVHTRVVVLLPRPNFICHVMDSYCGVALRAQIILSGHG